VQRWSKYCESKENHCLKIFQPRSLRLNVRLIYVIGKHDFNVQDTILMSKSAKKNTNENNMDWLDGWQRG
jgi:hypothetical protein